MRFSQPGPMPALSNRSRVLQLLQAAWHGAVGSIWGTECDRLTLLGLHPGTLALRSGHT